MIPPDAELTDAARRDPGLGRHARRPQAGARAPDGGLRRVPGAHRPPRRAADRRARGPRASSTTRSSTTSSATTARAPRARSTARFNEMIVLNGAADARDDRVHGVARSTTSARPRPTTTTRSAGRTRWTRRTSGPSRSPRTGAAPATARSCTGPTGIEGQGRGAPAVPPRHRRRADGPRGRRAPRADVRERHPAGAARGREHGLLRSTTPTPPSGTRRSTSRCSATAASTTRAGPR